MIPDGYTMVPLQGLFKQSDASGPYGLDAAGNPYLLGSKIGDYPVGATPVTAASANGANAQVTASLPAVADKTNYITGFEVTSGGATAGSLVDVVLSGLNDGASDSTYVLGVVAGAAIANQPLIVRFDPPLPASAVNTAITLTVPALGAGNTKARAVIHGFVL